MSATLDANVSISTGTLVAWVYGAITLDASTGSLDASATGFGRVGGKLNE